MRAGRVYLHDLDARSFPRRIPFALRLPAAAERAAAQPAGLRRRAARSRLQHLVSFITNTNWQNYSGETTMAISLRCSASRCTISSRRRPASHGLRAVRAVSCASSAQTVGNFWVDVTRIHALSPPADPRSPRVRRSWRSGSRRRCPEPDRCDDPRRRQADDLDRSGRYSGDHQGARHEWRRFLQRQSAHPFENPNALDQFSSRFGSLLLHTGRSRFWPSVASSAMCARAARSLATMAVFLLLGILVVYWSEAVGNPLLASLGVDRSLGNFEGKEIRFGQASRRCSPPDERHQHGRGQRDVRLDHAARRLVPMFFLLLGCIWPGGVGTGLYGLLSSRSSPCSSPG